MEFPVPIRVDPSYHTMLAIPLASDAVAVSVMEVAVVPDVGFADIVIVGAVVSAGGIASRDNCGKVAKMDTDIALDVAVFEFAELSVATAVMTRVPASKVFVSVAPVPICVVPSYHTMPAIPLASLAVAVRVIEVSVVPDVGFADIVIVGAVVSAAGGAVIVRVMVFDLFWLEFAELSVATAVMLCVPAANVFVIELPVPIWVGPSYHTMLAIPLASLAVAVSVIEVAVVPDVGFADIVIVGAVVSAAGGAVIVRVMVFDLFWLEFAELSVATAVMLCVPAANVFVIELPVPIWVGPSYHTMPAIPLASDAVALSVNEVSVVPDVPDDDMRMIGFVESAEVDLSIVIGSRIVADATFSFADLSYTNTTMLWTPTPNVVVCWRVISYALALFTLSVCMRRVPSYHLIIFIPLSSRAVAARVIDVDVPPFIGVAVIEVISGITISPSRSDACTTTVLVALDVLPASSVHVNIVLYFPGVSMSTEYWSI